MRTKSDKMIPSYGRRHGRHMSERKQNLLQEVLPNYSLTLPESNDKSPERIELSTLFSEKKNEIRLEIGFGAGEHLATIARKHPEYGFIGCEVYINGVVSLIDKIESAKVDNIRIFTEDARLLMQAMPEKSLSAIYLLFPDPWPKERHHKRRIVSDSFLQEAARILKPGAQLFIASDHSDYVSWALRHILTSQYFEWRAESARDWKNAGPEWVTTRYEKRHVLKEDLQSISGLYGCSPFEYKKAGLEKPAFLYI